MFSQCVIFLLFGMIMHNLPYCRLEVYNLPFDFTGSYNKEIFLSLRIDFETMLEDSGTFEAGLSVICIMI